MRFKQMLTCVFFTGMLTASFAQVRQPKAVIFDSDMGPDYDDVGAIALLHAFADSGYINILATVASTSYPGVAGVFNVLNTYFHRPGLPIGIPKLNGLNMRDRQHWSDTLLLKYPHAIQSNAEVPDAVAVYRSILAKQPDHSVTIISVGFFTNLANLLQSNPDRYTPLTGRQLVARKVKMLVSMAGKFPHGKEFNVEKDAASSQYVFMRWPVPVVFSGFEIGQKIKTGLPVIQNPGIQNSPVKDVFCICIPLDAADSAGRMSWDETAVLIAVKGIAPFYTVRTGKIIVDQDGANRWHDEGSQAYVVEHASPATVQQYINRLIMHQPVVPGRK